MNPRERLDEYLSALRGRLRLAIVARAGAMIALAILVGLSAAVYALNLRGFPVGGVIVSRAALSVVVAALIVALLWWPLTRLRRDAGASQFEERLPEQRGRIRTYLDEQRRERISPPSPLMGLLAEDALEVARKSPVETVVSSRGLWVAGTIVAVASLALLAMLTMAESEWGYGTRYVLLGVNIPRDAMPVRQVTLKPGNKIVRRNSDLNVQADVSGFNPENVELYVHYSDTDAETSSKTGWWERASMQHVEAGHYAFTLYALRAPLNYYVRADGVRSAEHRIEVVDVPRIERMRLVYTYPEWAHLRPHTETEVRDIRAVADTQVQVSLIASAPLEDPAIVVDRDSVTMQANATEVDGAILVSKPARYHIASRVAGERVALTDEYEISIVDDRAPTVEIVKPGRDARASSIEEVPVIVKAQDDFHLQDMELRYAVNGGDWKRMKLQARSTQAQAKTLLQLEELGGSQPLVPGDLITYYAVSGDGKQTAQTDLFMVEVQPFERRFTEGQAAGGRGNGEDGSEQQQIAERQRDLLMATWNLDRASEQRRRTSEQLKESAQLLSNLQSKLAEQTATLIERTRARVGVESDARVKNFIESLERAVQAMEPAATALKAVELPKAIPSEQTALQMLQRAEASFRDIQVARSQGGQGSRAARAGNDISELYELEMDLSKNKYETENALSQQDETQATDAAIEKLKELARRQEQLAEQRREPQSQQTQAERWKQEQLRREAEELRRRLQELASQRASQGASQGASQPAGRSGGTEQLQAALRNVENAVRAMQNAETTADRKAPAMASQALQQAAERMQRGDARSSSTNASSHGTVEQLADQATKIAEAQRNNQVDLRAALANATELSENPLRMRRDGLTQAQAKKLANRRSEMLGELRQWEDRLRNAVQSQRRSAPKTAQRLGEIANEWSSANASSRLSQTIVDLERGRADQSSLSDGLVTEALQNAASDLRSAARAAGQEAERKARSVEPEDLLAEVAQLRRALEDAKRTAASQIAPGESRYEETPSGEGVPNESGREAGGQRQRMDEGAARRMGNAIRRQLSAIEDRVAAGNVTPADLEALRQIAPDMRRLSGDAVAAQLDLIKGMERLELAALAAVERTASPIGARSGGMGEGSLRSSSFQNSLSQGAASSDSSAQDAANEGEAVAEYYRRLGK